MLSSKLVGGKVSSSLLLFLEYYTTLWDLSLSLLPFVLLFLSALLSYCRHSYLLLLCFQCTSCIISLLFKNIFASRQDEDPKTNPKASKVLIPSSDYWGLHLKCPSSPNWNCTEAIIWSDRHSFPNPYLVEEYIHMANLTALLIPTGKLQLHQAPLSLS